MTGPNTVTTHWVKRLASLIHEIRPEWAEPGIASALTKVADRPLADVAIAAIQAAATRTDQRTPAIIAMGGSHWGTHGATPVTAATVTGRRQPAQTAATMNTNISNSTTGHGATARASSHDAPTTGDTDMSDTARPAETVSESVPARHETPPALLDAMLAMNAAIDQFAAAKSAIESAARDLEAIRVSRLDHIDIDWSEPDHI